MNLLFLISMIVEAIFALGFILIPSTMQGLVGIQLDAVATTLARLFGSALLGYPTLLFYARRSDHVEFRRATVKTAFAYYLVSFIVLLIAQLAGQMNVMGWGVVVLHIIFIVWFGYFLLKKA